MRRARRSWRWQGREKTLWIADDNGLKAGGEKALSFWQASTEVQKLTRPDEPRGCDNHEGGRAVITVDEALKTYEPTLLQRGARASKKLQRRHLSEMLLSKPTLLLTGEDLEGFREACSKKASCPRAETGS
jgi:hypothetical protein